MKIDRVSYQKIFPTGMMYLNHKIGVEVQLADGDNPEHAFNLAKELVEMWNIKSNPGMAATMEYSNGFINKLPIQESQVDLKLGVTIDDINSCQDKSTLESYRLLVRNKPELETAFLSKLKEFI